MPTNNALHYLDKDFGFGGNALDESAEIKVKKIMYIFGLLAKRKGKKVITIIILSANLLIKPLNGCSPLTWNTPATV